MQNAREPGVAAELLPRARSTTQAIVDRFIGFVSHQTNDTLAVEEPLELRLGYGPPADRRVKSISVTMRTPGHDFELVAGFLLTEGMVSDAAEIEGIDSIDSTVHGDSVAYGSVAEGQTTEDASRVVLSHISPRNIVQVDLAGDVQVSLANLERNFYTTSSCGICGKASLLALRTVCPPRTANTLVMAADVLYSLPDKLRAGQDVFERTGGLHAAGLFDETGQLLSLREDVGRHNAVDKLVGREFLADRTPLRNRILLLSGRASFELLQKALMAGISMVVSVGAPSSLAVQVAKEFDISLVGFLRADHFNVYHGAERISGPVER